MTQISVNCLENQKANGCSNIAIVEDKTTLARVCGFSLTATTCG